MLTRQHFEIIARELRDAKPPANSRENDLRQDGYVVAVQAVARALHQINPRFDTDRFVRAVEGFDHA